MAALKKAQDELQAVNDRLAMLESNFNEATAKKEDLARQVKECEVRLSNADKLIGGLGGELVRWKETVALLNDQYDNIIGDVLVTAGTIGYLGAFTAEYRDDLTQDWRAAMTKGGIKHSDGCDIIQTLVVPTQLRHWQLAGLPVDSLSTQNGLVMDRARRWPLCIDPQGQANRFIKNYGADKEACEAGIDVVKQSEKNFIRSLENGVRFGKWILLENVGEELDAALEPVLLQQKFKSGGQVMMKIGENTIPYNDTFKFYMTSKLPNPHYPPEVCVKVTLLNFTITLAGLEEQLLGVTVQEEMPEMAEKKNELTIANAQMKKQLYDIESDILRLLANSEGNILDDTDLINTLAQAKVTSNEVTEKMKEAEVTEKEIDAASNDYRPVAYRASLLFFCIADLAVVDNMYQYSLPWYTGLFIMGIANSEKAAELSQRLDNLNDYFTYSVYKNTCRSLFEAHKLMFAFLLCVKILQGDDKIDAEEWRFLLSGIRPDSAQAENPDPHWIDARAWTEILCASTLPCFRGFEKDMVKPEILSGCKALFDSNAPQDVPLPGKWGKLDSLKQMCILRAFRPDKMMEAMQNYISEHLDKRFIQPPPFDLASAFEDSSNVIPIVFVLTQGCDPAKDLHNLCEDMGNLDQLKAIALGQGQGTIAQRLVDNAVESGDWVLLQNCHLFESWMPNLEAIVEGFNPAKIATEFRLWLTSMPVKFFPVLVLQSSVKLTKEPPKGLRANLNQTYFGLNDDLLEKTTKPHVYKKLLFGLAFFHALAIERKKFGPLGWNIPYSFNDTDLAISISQLEQFLDVYDEVPYTVLKFITAVINYGGRITDDKDIRTAEILIDGLYRPEMLEDGYAFSASGLYNSVAFDGDAPHQSYLDYIDALPINPEPEAFGMHANAAITCAQAETYDTFAIMLSLQPRVAGGTGKSREELISDQAAEIKARMPPLYECDAIQMMYPVRYDESMNTVLVQELEKFNRLLKVVHSSTKDVQLALKGLVVMSADLDAMGTAVFNQFVPGMWEEKAYPSLKPLAAWVQDLVDRLDFFSTWVDKGLPSVYWISGFFFPQAFMTGTLQNYARKHNYPIDECEMEYKFRDEEKEQLNKKPEDGAYIYGLFTEGARWSKEAHGLEDPIPKELFSTMPIIHLSPIRNKPVPKGKIYRCPVYKILTRTGVLSTTGHSTNFVFWMEVPSTREDCWRQSLVSETNANVKFCDQPDWIRAGVACFCSLRF